jgi:hypothetical protein
MERHLTRMDMQMLPMPPTLLQSYLPYRKAQYPNLSQYHRKLLPVHAPGDPPTSISTLTVPKLELGTTAMVYYWAEGVEKLSRS